MKPTFRPVVYAHHKRQDGTYNVKINVYFNGKERRLPTTIYCTKNDLTRTHHIKSQDILNKCNVLITKMYNAIADISIFDLDGRDVDWLVSRIKGRLRASDFRLDFFQYAQEYIQRKTVRTRRSYESALNAFALYLGKREIDINDITKQMILDFIKQYESRDKVNKSSKDGGWQQTSKKKKKGLMIDNYIGKLATIFKAAKAHYNDNDEEVVLIARSPFDNIHIEKEQRDGQKPLPKKVIQSLISYQTRKVNSYRLALDTMVVSFGLMGINVADLMEAKPPKDGIFYYNREKTKERRPDKAAMQVQVPAELHPYLERLGAGTDAEYWLPRLREFGKSKTRACTLINYHLNNWCAEQGIERFTTYALRKSWATLARSTGADKSLVDECIGHTGDYVLTDIYALKPYDKMAELNEKVLAMFQWQE